MTAIEFDELFGKFAILTKDSGDVMEFLHRGISYSIGKNYSCNWELFDDEVAGIIDWCLSEMNYENFTEPPEPTSDKHERNIIND